MHGSNVSLSVRSCDLCCCRGGKGAASNLVTDAKWAAVVVPILEVIGHKWKEMRSVRARVS